MLKKIVGLTLAALILFCLTVGGTWAFLHDDETSTANQVMAGTLDLNTNDADGVSQTLFATKFKPNRNIPIDDAAVIEMKNIGSLEGAHMNIDVTYIPSDDTFNTPNKSDDDVAKNLHVALLEWHRSNLMVYDADYTPNVPLTGLDLNGNGYVDVHDLKVATDGSHDYLNGLEGLLPIDVYPAEIKNFSMQLRVSNYHATLFNTDYQKDGIQITITFTLTQN